jgi:hypothetical protein
MLLGAHLILSGHIDLDQLEAALRSQHRFGGRLGKNLVEQGAISLDDLGLALSQQSGHPLAEDTQLRGADPQAITRLPDSLCRRLGAFPLALEKGPPLTLTCAVADPDDSEVMAQLALVSGCAIRACIAPELAIRTAIERVHGRADVPPPAGFVAAAGPTTFLPRGAGRPATIPPAPRPASFTMPPMPVRPRISLTDAMGRLQSVENRDGVADTIIEFAAGRAGAALLFLLREGAAAGWRSGVPALPDGAFTKLSLQLPPTSMLSRAATSRAPVRGQPAAVDAPLFAALAVGPPPPDAIVVPLVVGARVVNLLAAAGAGGAPLDDAAAEAIVALCAGAEDAYAQLIQHAKRKS